MASSQYVDYIATLADKNKSLGPLSKFLSQQSNDRYSPPIVHVVDYKKDATGHEEKPVASNPGTWAHLGQPPSDSRGRIILIENIDAGLMESIGSQLDIEPSFFSTYLWVSPLEGVDELLASSRELLPSQLAEALSLHLRYTRVIELPEDVDLHCAKASAKTTSNIKRTVYAVPSMQGQQNLAIVTACHCSVTLAPSREGRPWICA